MKLPIAILLLFLWPLNSSALTFKTGQVIGPDGKVYDGASPVQKQRLIEQAGKNPDKSVGIHGGSVFVIIDQEIVYVSVRDFVGKDEDQIKNLITANVIKAMSGVDINTTMLADKLEQNLGDVSKAVEQVVRQAGDKVMALYSSDKLDLVLDVANKFGKENVSSGRISQAVAIWDSLSPEAKQSMVDEANARKTAGCGTRTTCTVDGAEGFVDRLR